MKNISSWLSFALFTLLPLLSTSILSFYALKYQDFFFDLTPMYWLGLSILLTFGSALALCPPTFLAIILGYFKGFWAMPYLFIINLGAIAIIFFLSKLLNTAWFENLIEKNAKAKHVLTQIKKEELKFIFFAKLSPVLPFALTNLVFAISGARFKNILFAGFLGMIPRTLVAVYTGAQAKELQSLLDNPNQNFTTQIIIFSLVLISVWGLVIILKKAFLKPTDQL